MAEPDNVKVPTFEQLVAQTSSDLYRLATRLTGDHAEADDVLQTSYVRAFEALKAGAFHGQCQLTTWLYRIVMNVAIDAKRCSARREKVSHESSEVAAPERSEAAVELRELRDALELLPVDQRGALVLRELHGSSVRQTAEVLERSEGAVEQLLVRARTTLRARFES